MGAVSHSRRIGDAGERLAADLLAGQGFVVVGKGFRARRGEIDLLAKKNGELFVVEVKTRTSTRFGTPAEAAGLSKSQALQRAASEYRALAEWKGPIRFALMALMLDHDGRLKSSELTLDPF